jgi:hypothetical protein
LEWFCRRFEVRRSHEAPLQDVVDLYHSSSLSGIFVAALIVAFVEISAFLDNGCEKGCDKGGKKCGSDVNK